MTAVLKTRAQGAQPFWLWGSGTSCPRQDGLAVASALRKESPSGQTRRCPTGKMRVSPTRRAPVIQQTHQ